MGAGSRREVVKAVVRVLKRRGVVEPEALVDVILDLYEELSWLEAPATGAAAQPAATAETTPTAETATPTTATAAAAATDQWLARLGLIEKGICPKCGREFKNLHIQHGRHVHAYHGYSHGKRDCYIGFIDDLRRAGIDVHAIRERIRRGRLMAERLMSGVCPKCGQAARFRVRRQGVLTGGPVKVSLYAVHRGRECYIGRLDDVVRGLTSRGHSIEEIERALGISLGGQGGKGL